MRRGGRLFQTLKQPWWYLAPFVTYSDIKLDNCNFSEHSHLTPSLGVNPLEFIDERCKN